MVVVVVRTRAWVRPQCGGAVVFCHIRAFLINAIGTFICKSIGSMVKGRNQSQSCCVAHDGCGCCGEPRVRVGT